MGTYSENLKRRKELAAINDTLTKETDNNKNDTIAEVLKLFVENDQNKIPIEEIIKGIVDDKIAAAIASEGAITTWADGRYAAKQG